MVVWVPHGIYHYFGRQVYTVSEKVVCILPAPSAKYPKVYVHPCTKSTRLHEIPRCASHQGWSSRFLVTIGQGDSGMLFVAFPGIHFRWVVHGGAQDFYGNVCCPFEICLFWIILRITKVMRFGYITL